MQPTKHITDSPDATDDRASGEEPQRAAASGLGDGAAQATHREATRKYVERVNRYLARADGPRPTFDATTN